MVDCILLNKVKIEVDEYEVVPVVDEKTGKELKTIEIVFRKNTEQEREIFINLLNQNKFSFEVPEQNLVLDVTRSNLSYRYTDKSDYTTFTVSFKEIDPENIENVPESPYLFIFKGLIDVAIGNWLRTRAISELLQEKGIITKEEYDNQLSVVFERDHDKLLRELLDSFDQNLDEKSDK
ncbi:DUF4265 domain-containing protein [Brevibacillus sp. IT-7CA2]